MTQKEAFDPHAPFIHSENLLEYACAADWLLDKPLETHRNHTIRLQRANGRSTKQIRCWVEAYDEAIARVSRHFRAAQETQIYALQAADNALAVQIGRTILENERERHAYACSHGASALRARGL